MRFQLLSCNYILERMRRDTGITAFNFRGKDLREWVAEAIRNLKAQGQFAVNTVTLNVVNGRASLPDDFLGLAKLCSNAQVHYNQLLLPSSATSVCISYYSLPMDKEGFPMILDEPDVVEYVWWYTAWKQAHHPNVLPPTFDLNQMRVRWLDYQRAAQNTLKMPTTSAPSRFKSNNRRR